MFFSNSLTEIGSERIQGIFKFVRVKKWRKIRRRLFYFFVGGFAIVNILAIFHAYSFSHVSDKGTTENKQPENYSWSEKAVILFTGAPNYRRKIDRQPTTDFSEIHIQGDKELSAWYLSSAESKGTIALFHGYKSNKAALIDRGEFLHSLGYNTLLVDFEASGESEGNVCSIGYHEAGQVARTVQWINEHSKGPVILFGNSMGAAAVMKYACEQDFENQPPLMLECPFNSLYETTEARFESMDLPSFPLAEFLVFWGGAINGFNGFAHNPFEYASNIGSPALFLHGAKDDRVTSIHMQQIANAHAGETRLVSFQNAAHEDYFNQYELKWKQEVEMWLSQL